MSDERAVTVDRAASLLRLLASMPGRRDDALAVVNGLFGDSLADAGSSLAVPMTLRSGGQALTMERTALERAIDHPTAHVCVLVHGLMSRESVWAFPHDPTTDYGALLGRDHGVTPVFVRYNTGRHISANGRDLGRLLHHLVRAWPVRVRDLTLVGHSMGGLVIRAACHYAGDVKPWRGIGRLRRSWTTKVHRVVLIGSPNTGSRVEELVNLASAALWSFPIPATRLVGLGLDTRSAGIRDLRFGAIVDEDWLEQDPGLTERPVLHTVKAPRRARYLIVAGSLTADPEHPIAQLLGDALVTSSSAAGTVAGADGERGMVIPRAELRSLPNVGHLALAHRASVYDLIDEWF